MKNSFNALARRTVTSLFLLWMISFQPLQATLADYSKAQQQAYRYVAQELSTQNSNKVTAEEIEPRTYWVDAVNGIDDFGRSGNTR